jgi:hypothetical protein
MIIDSLKAISLLFNSTMASLNLRFPGLQVYPIIFINLYQLNMKVFVLFF